MSQATPTLEQRLDTLEHDFQEILEILEQMSRDAELLPVNLSRSVKDLRKPSRAGPKSASGPAPPKTETGPRQWTWDPLEIKWFPKEGQRGPYEVAEDPYSQEFNKLLKDLDEHKGALNRDNVFYWLFDNGQTVGRKVVK